MSEEIRNEIENKLAVLREAFNANKFPSLELRKHWLVALRKAILANEDQLLKGMELDFGSRSADEVKLVELIPVMATIKDNLKHLKKWLKPERRYLPWYLMPGKVRVHHQPLGVVGIITPWNYPIQLCLIPLIQALAAGNRVMVKVSEFAPETNKVIERIITQAFSEKEVAVIGHGSEAGKIFSTMPFDHLFFTGSTRVGKSVMANAAKNLTPVTLELGGKSPVIIGNKANLKQAAQSIAFGKGINAGQTCVAPDYVFCREDLLDDFIEHLTSTYKKYWQTITGNQEYAGLIHEARYKRIYFLMQDAKDKGHKIINLYNEEHSSELPQGKQFAPVLIINPSKDAAVMQEEIFGPLLPIITYKDIDEVLNFINQGDRPLALYHFSHDATELKQVLQNTKSGDICQNDSLIHVALENAPFGGVGASGIGAYHGKDGFLTFTHPRTCLTRWKFDLNSIVRPPYNNKPWLNWVYKSLQK